MSLMVSTKFKELILGPAAFASIFNNGRILVFSGPPPASADYPVQGVLLAQVTRDGLPWSPDGAGGAGLGFLQSGALVGKDPAQTWRLTASAAGVAGWFRLVGASADNGELSFNAPRIDGVVSNGGTAQLMLGNTTLTIGQTIDIPQFLYTIPPVPGA